MALSDDAIHQGVGSEIVVRPHDDGTVEIGGRTEIVQRREFLTTPTDPSISISSSS